MPPLRIKEGHHHRWLCLLIAVLAVLPYLNSLVAEFTFDDLGLIRNNPSVTGEHASALHVISTPQYRAGTGLYRPVVMLTYLANARVSHSPVGYHVVNVLLHALVTLVVFWVARIFLGSVWGATAAAILFAVHPIHTEAVTSIVGRAELLAALCALASIAASIHAGKNHGVKSGRWLLLSLTVLTVGLFCKESVFAAIALCAAVHVWAKQPRGATPVVAVLLPYTLLAGAYLVFRIFFFRSLTLELPDLLDNPLAHVPVLPRLETALVILWQYLSLLLVPLRLSADYSFPEIPVVATALDPRFLTAAGVFAALALTLVTAFKRAPVLIWAAAFFFIPLGLTANVLFPIGTIKAERLLYLPSFGWCLACAWLMMHAPGRPRVRQAVVAALIVALAGRTWVRNRDWQNNLTLFAATVATSPRSAKSHHNLGIMYEQTGQVDAAMSEYRQAYALDSTYAEAALGVGNMYQRKGLFGGALHWYAKASEIDPRLTQAYLNTGIVRNALGESSAAEAAFRAGLETEPDNPRLLAGLSISLIAQGRKPEAAAVIDRVIPLAKDDLAAQELLAFAQDGMKQVAHEGPPDSVDANERKPGSERQPAVSG